MSTDTNAMASSKHGQSSTGTGCWLTIISEIGITNNGTERFYKNRLREMNIQLTTPSSMDEPILHRILKYPIYSPDHCTHHDTDGTVGETVHRTIEPSVDDTK